MTSHVLIRLVLEDGAERPALLREFAGITLDEAIAKAMAYAADRSNFGIHPEPDAELVIERWSQETSEWIPVDLSDA